MLDRFIITEVFLAHLKLARGDVAGAAAMLAETEQTMRRNNFVQRMSEVAAAQVLTLLRQGDAAAAAQLAQIHDLPISQARAFLAQGDAARALALFSPLRQQMEQNGWQDERLRALVLTVASSKNSRCKTAPKPSPARASRACCGRANSPWLRQHNTLIHTLVSTQWGCHLAY